MKKEYLKGIAGLGIILILAWICAYMLSGYAGSRNTSTAPREEGDMVACTMEAKQCPNGSYVGRVGPNCEFSACPEMMTSYPGWTMSTDPVRGVSFQYPEVLEVRYMSTTAWPPTIKVAEGSLSCKEGGSEIAQQGVTEKKNIAGIEVCSKTRSEGAAGSIYRDYEYTREKAGQSITISFGIRGTQCGNYPPEQQQECEVERMAVNIDDLAGKILGTVKLQGEE